MKKQGIFYAVAISVAIIASWFFLSPAHRYYQNFPLHSSIEALEALSVLLMAIFLLGRKDEDGDERLTLPALGFLAMGILSSAHAASGPDKFIFLRTIANMAGGFGFSLVWLPASCRIAVYRRWLTWTVAAASLAFCVVAFFPYPVFPAMIQDGKFTTAAIGINFMAGMLFIAGTVRFAIDLRHSNELEHLLFSLIGLFFGLSGLTFQYLALWSEEWWFWHILRLIASLLVLGLLIRRHLQTVQILKRLLFDRKQADESLRRSYELTKTIIDSINDPISLIDVRDFRIVSVNRVFLKQYGYSEESEIAGKHCYEITHHRSDVCSPPDDICPLIETVKTGEHFLADHVHYDRGGEKIYVEVSTSPIKDENGNVLQVVHVQRNITDRKRAEQERERLLSDLARSNKELEQFAYVASHDLQEPLRMVTSYIQLLEKKYKGTLDQKADKYIHFVVDGTLRMQRLIDALLTYSRVTTRGAEFRPVDINGVFSQAVSNLAASVRESGAQVTTDDLTIVSGDEMQLVQLFQNLISNAIKYQKPGVKPVVRISQKKEQTQWIFSVRDNGIGIKPEYHARIFQIFQRLHTQEEYAGTGIGLAVCKKIVERHNGRIWVESQSGEGSTFFFTISIAENLSGSLEVKEKP